MPDSLLNRSLTTTLGSYRVLAEISRHSLYADNSAEHEYLGHRLLLRQELWTLPSTSVRRSRRFSDGASGRDCVRELTFPDALPDANAEQRPLALHRGRGRLS
jgi:hypothetical protein